MCDCTITLEMRVGSVLSSHFKNLSASFLGLLLVLCNSLCANCISSTFINICRPRNYTAHTIKSYRKLYRNFDIYPNIVSILYRNKNPDHTPLTGGSGLGFYCAIQTIRHPQTFFMYCILPCEGSFTLSLNFEISTQSM